MYVMGMKTNATKLSPEWIRRAGAYERACNAVRVADHDSSVSDADYAALVEVREAAFSHLKALDTRRG